MNFNIGDKVRYLNEVGEGIVIRIIDNKTIEIENEHGLNVPVAIKELVKIGNDAKFKEESSEPKEVQTYVTNISYNYAERDQWDYLSEDKTIADSSKKDIDNSTNIYLAFVPENDENISKSDLNLYLINDSKFHLLVNISIEEQNEYVNIEAGNIEPNIKSYISTYKREDISKLNNILVQIIFYKTGYYNPRNTLNETFKIKG